MKAIELLLILALLCAITAEVIVSDIIKNF